MLRHGADDYLTKPFSAKQLAARMKAVVRRCQTDPYRQPASRVTVGDLVLDLQSHDVSRGKEAVQPGPFDLCPRVRFGSFSTVRIDAS